jgi:uncharacterized lipoprotein YehR (DUF1307 family)
MKLLQLLALSAVGTALAVSLSGCDMAEQTGRELAAKAEQSAKQMVQETLKESVNTLNEKVDQAQQSAETWIGKPPAVSDEAVQPEAPKPAAPGGTIET